MIQLEKNGIYTFEYFMDGTEIMHWKDWLNEKLQDPDSIGFNPTTNFENLKHIDNAVAQHFYSKLVNFIEPSILATRSNTFIMAGKYYPGNNFPIHTDSGLYFNMLAKEKTNWTLLIYLTDNFEGGETVFYDNHFQQICRIVPKAGMALLFDIDLLHKAEKIKNGMKEWIGCEIIGQYTDEFVPNNI